MTKKRVAVQLPAVAKQIPLEERYSLELESLGDVAELYEADTSSPAAFIDGVRDADAILTSWGVRIDQQVIAGLEKCAVIGVGSVGVDMVDVDAATEAGIVVTNVPDVFIEEVADHTMMFLLACHRRQKEMDQLVQNGDWYKGRPILEKNPRLWGQTLGLISFGNVATAVARRAKAFGLHVIAYDPYVTELKMTAEGVQPVSLEELLTMSDYISVHPGLNDTSRAMLSDDQFSRMKDGVYIINCGRGPTIDQAALVRALDSGKVGAAGLDVLEKEPIDPNDPLLGRDNVMLSPHAASATDRMRPETRRRAAREVRLVLEGKWPMSCVNPTVLPKVDLERWQPYPMNRGPNR
ncbi:MAG: C-terminal binding protein [Pseudomonadales bacterium]|nr:C-terminal binding protein [Pseudomonadales bacterium]MBO6597428.1 C-terminal binding protein [Pseudomonadales bacterium]MBO6703077.1 C-terminal binding protein [Pseudomonadales bacterium]MBO6824162.1 C-terminal binding protein [Pseudomonadales bacterium]MBO7006288.1 C-terminal binding protein [Pseudomonadales bacterium]